MTGEPPSRGSHAPLVLAFRAIAGYSGRMRDLFGSMNAAGLAGEWDRYARDAGDLVGLAGEAKAVRVPDRRLRGHWTAMLAAAEAMASSGSVDGLLAASDQYVAAHTAMQARCDELVASLTKGRPGAT